LRLLKTAGSGNQPMLIPPALLGGRRVGGGGVQHPAGVTFYGDCRCVSKTGRGDPATRGNHRVSCNKGGGKQGGGKEVVF